MSLFKQMAIILSFFLIVILASVMVLNFKSATEFVQNQLYTDAKNTAHSLGLSLSKVADPNDTSSMETMINAIFDSGYYEMIRLVDLDGKQIYIRQNDVRVHDVPQWFVQRIAIRNVTVKSDIMMGWNRFGTLEVSGHTGHAYRQLYITFIDLIKTFLVVGSIVFILLYLLLSLSLKSLVRVRNQALAIIDNEFIIEKKIPFTTEFRSVTVAMNAMVAKVKDIFDRENATLLHYQELLYKDPETKLYNRRYLAVKLQDYLQSHSSLSSGVYVIVSFDEVERLKRELGYHQDCTLMKELANDLLSQFESFRNALIIRLNESDFFVVIPESDISAIHPLLENVMNHMHSVMEEIDSVLSYLTIGCGIGTYSERDTLKSLFSRADHVVVEAKQKGNFTIDVCQKEGETLILGREEWRNELLQSLEESRILLAVQDVVEVQSGILNVIHKEVYLRLLDRDGNIQTAGYFIPVATSLGLIETLDRYVIEEALKYINAHSFNAPLALNLSSDFIKKSANISWLKEQLEAFHLQNNLVLWFEVNNATALHELEAVSSIGSMFKKLGYQFGIDHFTIPEEGATYLQDIRPDYIKVNGTYLQDIMVEKETGKRMESFTNLARTLDIMVIAINIEDENEIKNLKELGIERFEGSYISPVTLLQ
ncbi:LapD/MoxY N-terminal periplasmic domain-containing protein [Sulfuricurvum sp.]|uniref:bifunctional diguanylate cyclase/phosphodiesterase n=1 Tax=Sulfuricurvum sp. TaxID=2025608 RepID=UPI00260A8C40|nr:LapD/MoxY N-terminal periplasmic domain-containing protein [Sulfuricurvum sp.]MDD2267393.1 LapD/MoxY N-terminal periplasmic domain-containing protein [Sulfuricurvum sp.]MDD2783073.1 LapD/MoxY N-terminal periplasmic domain-containing protein [Sulfuricurvum sp.]